MYNHSSVSQLQSSPIVHEPNEAVCLCGDCGELYSLAAGRIHIAAGRLHHVVGRMYSVVRQKLTEVNWWHSG